MITAGIDYGAADTRCVVMKDEVILGKGLAQTCFVPEKSTELSLASAIRDAGISGSEIERIGATGSGRFLGGSADVVLSDVESLALAAHLFFPCARTVFDIGDERSVAVRIDRDGGVQDFVVNRECAAEAGVYMKSIGRLIENESVGTGSMGPGTNERIPLNGQCLIFAEREIPELIRGGVRPADILRTAHEALATRIASMVHRIGVMEDVVMTGAIVSDPYFMEFLRSRIEVEKIHVPDLPAFAAAAGAAAAAARDDRSGNREEGVEARDFVVLTWPGSIAAWQKSGESGPPAPTRWRDPGIDLEGASFVTVGVDIGSACTKACMVADGRISAYVTMCAADGEKGAARVFRSLLDSAGVSEDRVDYCVCTGCGRVRFPFADRTITETACHARGANFIYGPSVRTVLDVGGQEVKAIRCDGRGKVADFLVNDKCAAGTGAALEVFAGLLGVPLADFGRRSLQVEKDPAALPDTCVVHAWSRAREMMAKGRGVEDVIAAFCRSCADRLHSLLEKAGVEPGLGVTGGVAKNRGVVERLTPLLGFEPMTTSWDPQIAGAAGAALFGYALCVKRKKPRQMGES
ncbi:MAG TPA: hypothetical protein ENN79_11415 [Desulfobacteraceae bacterium]|nr:hypothetical protein [Desulfobacteraceae bacterium]